MAAEAFQSNLVRIADPACIYAKQLRSQTAKKTLRTLEDWADCMHKYEKQVKDPRDRVYLVASDIRLSEVSYQASRKSTSSKHDPDDFISTLKLQTLHEKHWAVETDGRYYELFQQEGDSEFSCRAYVDNDFRHVIARIFIGCTHMGHIALQAIGMGVIATQTNYQTTRNNCQRFVRIFASMIICPQHGIDTMEIFPFDVEQHVLTVRLDQRSGRRHRALLNRYLRDVHIGEASRLVGEGITWQSKNLEIGGELRRISRRVTVDYKYRSAEDGGVQPSGKYPVSQEETYYVWEIDPLCIKTFRNCKFMSRNPYINLMRFDKFTHYTIKTRSLWTSGSLFSPALYASSRKETMVKGPYGCYWCDCYPSFFQRRVTILDKNGVLRDGEGARLEESSGERIIPRHLVDEVHFALEKLAATTSDKFLPSSPLADLGRVIANGLGHRVLKHIS